MFLALIFSIQAFAADVAIPGLSAKTFALKAGNPEFCSPAIRPEITTVEGRTVLVIDVHNRFLWEKISEPGVSQEIEETADKSQLKLIDGNERRLLKLSGNEIELQVNNVRKDKHGVVQIDTHLQGIRCRWVAR
jgi:hypothetical protein